MSISRNLQDREKDKFFETPNEDTAVRVGVVTSISEELSVVSSQDASSNYTSSSINVQSYSSGSLIATWTGFDSSVGTFDLEGSNDESNWAVISNAGVRISETPSGVFAWEFISFSFSFIRVVYTANTVSSGSFDLRIYGKR